MWGLLWCFILFGAEAWVVRRVGGRGGSSRAPALREEREFDLVVLGGGPVGVSAALRARSLGRSAILIDATPAKQFQFTGPTGLYSKALRDAALRLDVAVLRRMGLGDGAIWAQVREMVDRIVRKVGDDNAKGLAVSRVPHLRGVGTVRPVGDGRVEVDVAFRREAARSRGGDEGEGRGTTVFAKHCVVATGSRAVRFGCLDYDLVDRVGQRRVFDSDGIKGLAFLPRTVCIVGGGIIAVEFARIFAALAADVTMIVRSQDLPTSLRRVGIDAGLAAALQEDLERAGVVLRFGSTLRGAAVGDGGGVLDVALAGGATLETDVLLTATGRRAASEGVFEDVVDGLLAENGDVIVDGALRTAHRCVSAAGDVIGAPQLASTGVAQAEAAVDAAFKADGGGFDEAMAATGLRAVEEGRYPVGIWTIPEVAFVGVTADAARRAGADVVVGLAKYADTVRGHVQQPASALNANKARRSVGPCLKLVVKREAPHAIVGVHLFGDDAAELVHFGTFLVNKAMTCDDAAQVCYAAVTYHELYKLAANDAKDAIRRDAWRDAFRALVDVERADATAPSATDAGHLHESTLRAALATNDVPDDDRKAIARALFAGAKVCRGDLFVRRAMRLRGSLASAVAAAAAPPPATLLEPS